MEKDKLTNEIGPEHMMDLKFEEPNVFKFCVDKLIIDSEKLCVSFNDAIWNLEKIDTLEFEMEGKKYTYKKEIKSQEED